jgi:hypothetical protein
LAVAAPQHLFDGQTEDHAIVGGCHGFPDRTSVSVHRPAAVVQRSPIPLPTSRPLSTPGSSARLLDVHGLQRQHVNAGRDPPELRRLPSLHTPFLACSIGLRLRIRCAEDGGGLVVARSLQHSVASSRLTGSGIAMTRPGADTGLSSNRDTANRSAASETVRWSNGE